MGPKEGKLFYNKIIFLVENVFDRVKNKKEKYLHAVYENNNYLLINDDEIIKKMELTIFFNKFRSILFDFHRDLIWNFKCIFYLNNLCLHN